MMNVPAYPPTSDIGYALWLRNFSFLLPSLAERYEISQEELSDVQRIAAEFTDWLIYRIHYTTQKIRLSEAPTDTAYALGPEPPIPQEIFLLHRIADLVHRLHDHPAYCAADGCALGLFKTVIAKNSLSVSDLLAAGSTLVP